jgi:hypothetical protein
MSVSSFEPLLIALLACRFKPSIAVLLADNVSKSLFP